MGYALGPFASVGVGEGLLRMLLAEHAERVVPALARLWRYYRNPAEASASNPGRGRPGSLKLRLAQEAGLPTRITGGVDTALDDRDWQREAVVENDIGWRVQLMVDFMFGKPVLIASTAPGEGRRRAIERVLDAVWERSGGIALLQDMALLGHVYGHVDLVLRAVGAGLEGGRGWLAPSPAPPPAPGGAGMDDAALAAVAERAALAVRVEVVEPTRGIPVLDPSDYRKLAAYVIAFERELNEVEGSGAGRAIASLWRGREAAKRRRACYTEVISGAWRQVYHDERLVEEEDLWWAGGEPPVVHIQNVSQPFRYGGLGEVEPLIPLQDELNTRLSDRAARVTMQSFKMYLARGLDGFERVPVGPGKVWTTENLQASVQEFGGDAEAPGEETHIQEVREAMDKTSLVCRLSATRPLCCVGSPPPHPGSPAFGSHRRTPARTPSIGTVRGLPKGVRPTHVAVRVSVGAR